MDKWFCSLQIANRHIKCHCLLHALLLHVLICTFRCHSSFRSSRKTHVWKRSSRVRRGRHFRCSSNVGEAAEVLDLLPRVRSSAKFGTFSLSTQLWGKLQAAKPGEAPGHQSLLLNAAFGTRKFVFGQCRFKRHCWSFSILCFPCKEAL